MQAKVGMLLLKTHVQDSCIHHFVYTYMHKLKLKSYTDALPNERLLYYRRYHSSVLELCVRYDRRVMDPKMYCSFFPM